jgi:hypothetical protein
MSKKATDEKQQQPAYVEELLKNGTTVLTAKTRDGLADMVNDIPANVRYGAGAAGYNPETGAFTLRVDIIND